ncbi:MAG: TatD family hydrolase [Desulfosalsimonadaceae bacterium]|nr:TatD family hydrolase [Desulfosalsimonadaceae bacterium]
MKLFDSHCHLNDSVYNKDMDQVFLRASAAGVRGMMIVGIDGPTSRQAVSLARTHAKGDSVCVASVGVHPHDASACTEKTLGELTELAKNPEIKAWGETGLDFNRMFSPQKDQEHWFVRQLEAADRLNLPLIFHERDSRGRFLEILNAHYGNAGRAGVVHCFSGNRKEMDAYLGFGLHIGVTGILTIQSRGRELRDLAIHIPADRLLIETDAPYLTPAPEKNQIRRNEPGFVRSVLMKLSEIRSEDPEALAQTVWDNTCRLFNIPQE